MAFWEDHLKTNFYGVNSYTCNLYGDIIHYNYKINKLPYLVIKTNILHN